MEGQVTENMNECSGGKEEDRPTLEEMFTRLDKVVEQLGREGVSLEESFGLYQDGMTLLKECCSAIDEVEKKVLILDEDGNTDEF